MVAEEWGEILLRFSRDQEKRLLRELAQMPPGTVVKVKPDEGARFQGVQAMTTHKDEIVERLRRGVTWSDGKPIEAIVGAVNDPIMREAADLIEQQASTIERMEEALRKCRELFTEIRMDWSDPRAECREGWAVIDAALTNRERMDG